MFLLTIAIVFWLASSFVEYKIVSAWPKLAFLFHGITGVVISLAIGAILAWAVGASNAMPIVLAQIVGLATNDFTFKFYSTLAKGNEKRKQYAAIPTQTKSDFMTGVKGAAKFAGGCFVLLGKIIRYTGVTLGFITHPKQSYKKLRIDHRLPWEKSPEWRNTL